MYEATNFNQSQIPRVLNDIIYEYIKEPDEKYQVRIKLSTLMNNLGF